MKKDVRIVILSLFICSGLSAAHGGNNVRRGPTVPLFMEETRATVREQAQEASDRAFDCGCLGLASMFSSAAASVVATDGGQMVPDSIVPCVFVGLSAGAAVVCCHCDCCLLP